MAHVCSVSGCSTGSKSRLSVGLFPGCHQKPLRMHRFPKDPMYQQLWVSACKKKKPINVSSTRSKN